jgi:diaminohydroxyphosphoribosylaminopyrimidine deaminase/5-amino-6-(5-phosphoribosylamino)uracil reductase
VIADLTYLHLALGEAKKGEGQCAPNPAVGALVVKDGIVVSTGYHRGVGHAHAEVNALATIDARGATLYVTLEPCCHYGRTPPCTEAIIHAGIVRVVFALKDPYQHTTTTGEAVLLQHGIACECVALAEITQFYRPYVHWVRTGRPWVTAKLAVSINGVTAGERGEPLAITGEACRVFTHTQRLHADALLTTARTIIADDPQLNVRLEHVLMKKPVYVVDRHLLTPHGAMLAHTAASLTLFHGEVTVPVKNAGHLIQETSLSRMLTVIGAQGHHRVWVEAGPQLFTALCASNLLHEAYVYISPRWFASPRKYTAGLNVMAWANSVEVMWLGDDSVLHYSV